MLEFSTLTLEDKGWVDELVMSENTMAAGYNFGNIYLWSKNRQGMVARYGDRMITKLRFFDDVAFTSPLAAGSCARLLRRCGNTARSRAAP